MIASLYRVRTEYQLVYDLHVTVYLWPCAYGRRSDYYYALTGQRSPGTDRCAELAYEAMLERDGGAPGQLP